MSSRRDARRGHPRGGDRSATRRSSATTRSPTTRGSASPTRSRSSSATTASLSGSSARSRRRPVPITSSCSPTTARHRARRFASAIGETLEEVVAASARARRRARTGGHRRGLGRLGAVLADARQEPSVRRRDARPRNPQPVGRRERSRWGPIATRSSEAEQPRRAREEEAVVLVSGQPRAGLPPTLSQRADASSR